MKYTNKKILKLIVIFMLPIFVYIIAYLLIKYNGTSICLWKNIFHTDCYGCGITRAFYALCHLNFKDAMNYNSRIFIVVSILLCIWIIEIIKICKR